MVEIVVQIEDKYGVKIFDEDFVGLCIVGDVVVYIQKFEEENLEVVQVLCVKIELENFDVVVNVQVRFEVEFK